MAIINCPECGKQVSNHAAACPNCGFPQLTKNTETHGGLSAADLPPKQDLSNAGPLPQDPNSIYSKAICEKCRQPSLKFIKNAGRDYKNLLFAAASIVVAFFFANVDFLPENWRNYVVGTLFLMSVVFAFFGLKRQSLVICTNCGKQTFVL